MNVINASETNILHIGYAGEKNRTQVRFYYGDLLEEFPGGSVFLQVKRPEEDAYYIVDLTTDGEGYAIWTVANYDCATRGFGECQLIYSTSDTIAKRKVWRTNIDQSIEGLNIDIPSDWEDIETRLLNAAGAVRGAIDNAEQTMGEYLTANRQYTQRSETAASNAERDAGTATQQARTATDAAASAQNSASVAGSSANAAQNYASNADAAAGRAGTAANTAESAATNANAYRNEARESAQTARDQAARATTAADNAKGYMDDALEASDIATEAAQDAALDALRAEGYAVGTQNGSPVSQGSTYFENNSKHYAEQAEAAMTQITEELALHAGVPFVQGVVDGNYWGGTLTNVDALEQGFTMVYKIPAAFSAGTTKQIRLTLADGSTSTPYSIQSRTDQEYYSGEILILTYDPPYWQCSDRDYNSHLMYQVKSVQSDSLTIYSDKNFYPTVPGYSLLRISENCTFSSGREGLGRLLMIRFVGSSRQFNLYVNGSNSCGYVDGDMWGGPVVLPKGDYLFYYDGNQRVDLRTDGHVPGAKGETGNSGVYVGTTEPEDPEVNVWIDPTAGTSLLYVGDNEPEDPYVGVWVDTNGEEGAVDPTPVYACYASHTGDTNYWNVTIPGVPYINGMTLIVRFQNLQYTGGSQAYLTVNGQAFEWDGASNQHGPAVYKADHTAFTDAVPFNGVLTMTLFDNEWVVH